jgi:hypothetical protein
MLMQVVLFVSIEWPCGRRLLDNQEIFVYALFIASRYRAAGVYLICLVKQDSYRLY